MLSIITGVLYLRARHNEACMCAEDVLSRVRPMERRQGGSVKKRQMVDESWDNLIFAHLSLKLSSQTSGSSLRSTITKDGMLQ